MRRNIFIYCFLWLLFTSGAKAETVWVEGLSLLYEKPHAAAFAVELSTGFVVVAVDQRTGKACHVRLRPVKELNEIPSQSELSSWPASASLPLTQVRAEWLGGQLRLSMLFQRSISCSFQISTDQHSLWVAVEPLDEEIDQQIKNRMQMARESLIAGAYENAAGIYRDLVYGAEYGKLEHPLQQQAMEYLGVALERQGKFEEAARIYRRYLERYPDAHENVRIQQRLNGLESMRETEKAPLRKAKSRQQEPMLWYGVLSNSYQLYRSDNGLSDMQTEQSSLQSDLNLSGRYRDAEADMRVLLSTGYQHDAVRDLEHPGRLSKAYVDLSHHRSAQQFRLGRQSTSGEGILGRYDGLHYRKSLASDYDLNAVLGFPVQSSRDFSIDQDQRLYGVSLDIGDRGSPWRGNVFATRQETQDFVNRQALGGEINYLSQAKNLLVYFDYDIYFNELNTVTVNGNWFSESDAHYYLTADYRRSPTLTLSNALIGQTLTELDQLAQSGLTESELEEVALDRSAISKSLNVGASRRFHPNYRWALDAGLWELSGTDTSLGVSGFDGSDLETNLRLQLLGNDLIKDRDLLWLTLRMADLTTSRLIAFTTDWRVPLTQAWRLRPKLQVYQRTFTETDGKQNSIQPNLRLEYKASQAWQFEMNLGAEWLSTEQNNIEVDIFNVLYSLRADWIF